MLSFFALAFLIGMGHALEADHVAAVSAMAVHKKDRSSIVRTGAVWGLGHAITLTLFAGVALVLGLSFKAELVDWLEFLVGLMLMGLGGHILYRLVRDRIHVHIHRHDRGQAHFHAHSHVGEAVTAHDPASHDHGHHGHGPFPFKSLFVGMMHGMAGSAALLILTASSAPTPLMGLAYMALFGLGSVLGMAALSAIIAVPIALSANILTWANRTIHLGTGLATLALGLYTVFSSHMVG